MIPAHFTEKNLRGRVPRPQRNLTGLVCFASSNLVDAAPKSIYGEVADSQRVGVAGDGFGW